MSAALEVLIGVARRRKSPKQALKNTLTKAARKHLGDGRRRRKTIASGLRIKRSVGAHKKKTTIRRKKNLRDVEQIFSNIKK